MLGVQPNQSIYTTATNDLTWGIARLWKLYVYFKGFAKMACAHSLFQIKRSGYRWKKGLWLSVIIILIIKYLVIIINVFFKLCIVKHWKHDFMMIMFGGVKSLVLSDKQSKAQRFLSKTANSQTWETGSNKCVAFLHYKQLIINALVFCWSTN